MLTHTPTYYRVRAAVRYLVGLTATAGICAVILWASAPY